MIKVAIDAMGGDLAPDEVVKGTVESAKNLPELKHILVGKKELLGGPYHVENIQVEDASQVIEMGDHPVEALKTKRDSSISKCIKLLLNNEAGAVVSAGNTGALFVASRFKLGLLHGIKRPAIAVPIPTKKGYSILIDAGANVGSKPLHLLQFAIMGSIYLKTINPNIQNPSIGLVNIGEESSKGSRLLKLAYELFKKVDMNFKGNVEGHTVFTGESDIIVCDGFIGNIMLKMGEGLVNFFSEKILTYDPSLAKPLASIAKTFDYTEYGGAPLLGVNGIVVICHGRSNSKAIQNAIGLANRLAERNLNDLISAEIKKITLWKRVSRWFQSKFKEKDDEE